MKRREFLTGAIAGAVPGAAATWLGRSARNRDRAAWERDRALWEKERAKIPTDEFRMSFSQQGEDIVLFHVLRDLLRANPPTYLDVGAAHPVKSNNTYLLYTTGGHGVLVEPNPMYADLLRQKRPRDKVVQAGIGVTDQAEADYYEIKGAPMLNTFSPEEVAYLQKGKTDSVVERVVKMPLININRVIAAGFGKTPDLISTDIEGLDYAVLKSLDLSKYRPGVICAEGVPMYTPTRQSDLTRYLLAQDYVVRGGSTVNTIYVDARRLEGAGS